MNKKVLEQSLEMVNRRLDAKRIPKGVQKVMDILGGDIGEDCSISDLKDVLKVFQNFKNVLYCAENVHPNNTNINAVDKMTKIVDDFEKAMRHVSNYETQTQIEDFKIFNATLKQIHSAVPETWFDLFCNKLNIIEINSDCCDMYNLPTPVDSYMAVNQGRYFVMLDPENDKCVEIAEVRLDMLEVLRKTLKEAINNKNIDWSVNRSTINYKN